jgi:hypothetical protein
MIACCGYPLAAFFIWTIAMKAPHVIVGQSASFPGMMVAEESAELVDDPFDRAFIVAVGPLESLAGMRVDEPQPTQREGWASYRTRHRWPCGTSS